jgi:hypothetical protein
MLAQEMNGRFCMAAMRFVHCTIKPSFSLEWGTRANPRMGRDSGQAESKMVGFENRSGAYFRMSRKSGFRFSDKDMRQPKNT